MMKHRTRHRQSHDSKWGTINWWGLSQGLQGTYMLHLRILNANIHYGHGSHSSVQTIGVGVSPTPFRTSFYLSEMELAGNSASPGMDGKVYTKGDLKMPSELCCEQEKKSGSFRNLVQSQTCCETGFSTPCMLPFSVVISWTLRPNKAGLTKQLVLGLLLFLLFLRQDLTIQF